MKKSIFNTLAIVLTGFAFVSCSDVEIASTPALNKVDNLSAVAEARNVTVSWQNPSNATGVRLYKTDALGEHLLIDKDSIFTSYFDKHVATNTDLIYTVKSRFDGGLLSEGQSTTINVKYESHAKPAMLITANTIDAIPDDDEKAAAEWFQKAYPDGKILTPDDYADFYPDEYSVIWVQIDRVGIEQGWQKLPANMVSDNVINALKEYVKEGGNLLLTKHATQLTVAVGRLTEQFGPHLFSAGEGGVGTDNWTVNASIGSDQSEPYDHRQHAIYAGMQTNMDFGHESYGLEGPGLREDHNCMWDLNSYGLPALVPNAGNVVKAFETLENCTVLGTWGHVTDYCCGGIIEFNPTTDIAGRILCIGLNAYEWNENGTVNTYQKNIELLTQNSINYLSK